MKNKTYSLYTLEFPIFEKSKDEPECFQIIKWGNRTNFQKEIDRKTYFYFKGSSGVHLKDVLTNILKANEKTHDVPEEYLLEKLYINNGNNSHFTELGIKLYISKYAHEYIKNPKNADKKSDKKYVIICYAVHNQEISSCDIFTSENEAYDFLDKDAENTYNEEVENSGNNADNIELDIDGDTAKLINYDADCIWTWHVLTV